VGERLSGLEMDALLGGWRSGTIIVVLTGFFDESGEHAADGSLTRLTLGGFFAEWSQVKSLCERWREALDAEGLSEFHMKEIASDEHAFATWPTARQRRLMRFVEITGDCARDFRAFSYPIDESNRAFREAYETAVSRIMMDACTLAHESGQRVNLVFAYTKEVSAGRIGEYFDHANWGDELSSYKVARSRDEPALQAAEIVARGLKRLFEKNEITPSFAGLIATGKDFRFWPPNPVAAARARGL
jgi:hypothetical protein